MLRYFFGPIFLFAEMRLSHFCAVLVLSTQTLPSNVVSLKRYELEKEALKLYGEEFYRLLIRFRSTSDYHDILAAKLKSLKEHYEQMLLKITGHYKKTMPKRIKDLLDKDDETNHVAQDKQEHISQQPEAGGSPVQELDNYGYFHRELTVKQANKMRDMAFDLFGETLDEYLKHILSEEYNSVITAMTGHEHPTTARHKFVVTKDTPKMSTRYGRIIPVRSKLKPATKMF